MQGHLFYHMELHCYPEALVLCLPRNAIDAFTVEKRGHLNE